MALILYIFQKLFVKIFYIAFRKFERFPRIKTFSSNSKYPFTSCLSRSVNFWISMPRISFSTSSSDRRAPSMRVDAPVEVIKTDRLRRPKTCGERRPGDPLPFNSSICVIFDQSSDGIDEILSSKRLFLAYLYPLNASKLSYTLTILDYSRLRN